MRLSLGDFANRLLGSEMIVGAVEASLEGLGRAAAEEMRSRFGRYQSGWPRLSPSTIERKGANVPLIGTGDYRDSIHYAMRSLAVEVGSDNPVAVFHEFGTSHVPPRPLIIPAGEETLVRYAPALAEAVVTVWRKG